MLKLLVFSKPKNPQPVNNTKALDKLLYRLKTSILMPTISEWRGISGIPLNNTVNNNMAFLILLYEHVRNSTLDSQV